MHELCIWHYKNAVIGNTAYRENCGIVSCLQFLHSRLKVDKKKREKRSAILQRKLEEISFRQKSFKVCRNELIAAFHQNWEKSCLPTITKKSFETKLTCSWINIVNLTTKAGYWGANSWKNY